MGQDYKKGMLQSRSCAVLVLPVLIGTVLFMSSCVVAAPAPTTPPSTKTPQLPPLPENHNPVIHSMASEIEVLPSSTSRITCYASDADDDTITYAWSSNGMGTIVGVGDTITWNAPKDPGVYVINVLVTDGKGGETKKSVVVMVAAEPPNRAPIMVLKVREMGKPEIVVTPLASYKIIVKGCPSYEIECLANDPEGDPLTYEWNASLGKVDGEGTKVNYLVCQPGVFSVTATVTDKKGAQEKVTVFFEVPSRP